MSDEKSSRCEGTSSGATPENTGEAVAPRLVLVVTGMQGCGKTTQAAKLCRRYNLCLTSIDLLLKVPPAQIWTVEPYQLLSRAWVFGMELAWIVI